MDIRAAYDWSRIMDWLDSDITTYTIKNAIGFVIVWWLARGWFRAAPADQALTDCRSSRTIPYKIRPCRARVLSGAKASRIAACRPADPDRSRLCLNGPG